MSYSPSCMREPLESRVSNDHPAAKRTASGTSRLAVAARRSSACGTNGKLRDKGSNLDLRVQSAVSCRLDDPGSCVSVQPARARRKRTSSPWCSAHAEPPMSMPLAYPSTLDRRPQACTSAGRCHRGGALEPEPRTSARKSVRKSKRECVFAIPALSAEESFSLRRGLDSI